MSSESPFDPQDRALASTLKEAFPAGEVSPALERKMELKETQQSVRDRRQSGPRFKKFIFVFAFAAVAVLAVAAFKYLMGRPGEAAIQLIPADADIISTLDTNPSEQQIGAFSRILTALNREGMVSKVDTIVNKALQQSKIASDIQPYVSKNFAFAGWKSGATIASPEPAFFLASTNNDKILAALQADAQPTSQPNLFLLKENLYGGIISNYLVITQSQQRFNQILAVANHQARSAADLPQYQAARATLPSDSNLMLFMSPKGLMGDSSLVSKDNPLVSDNWFAMGVAVRDQGLATYYRYPLRVKDAKGWERFGDVASFDMSALKEVPAGAYGVIGLSQLGKVVQGSYEVAGENKDFGPSITKWEQENKISVLNDVVPALSGNAQIVVYPGVTGQAKDIDALVVFDNAHNSDPAGLARKIRTLFEDPAEGQTPVRFDESQQGKATVWQLDHSTSDKLKQTVGDLSRDKDLDVILVNGNVIITTSAVMVNKVLGVYNSNQKSLADDAPFFAMANIAGNNSQANIMISVSRVMNALRPQIEASMSGSGNKVNPDDIIRLFGGNDAGLVGTTQYDGQNVNAQLFLPLDYDRAIHLMALGAAEGEKNFGTPAIPSPTAHVETGPDGKPNVSVNITP
jgi:hypothetical protein